MTLFSWYSVELVIVYQLTPTFWILLWFLLLLVQEKPSQGAILPLAFLKIIFEGLFYFWSRKTFMTYCHASMHCAGLFPFPKVHSHLWHFIPKAIFCTVRSAYQLNHEVKRWGTGKHWTTRMVRTQNGLEQSKNKITNPEAAPPTYIYHYHSVIQKRVKYGLPI